MRPPSRARLPAPEAIDDRVRRARRRLPRRVVRARARFRDVGRDARSRCPLAGPVERRPGPPPRRRGRRPAGPGAVRREDGPHPPRHDDDPRPDPGRCGTRVPRDPRGDDPDRSRDRRALARSGRRPARRRRRARPGGPGRGRPGPTAASRRRRRPGRSTSGRVCRRPSSRPTSSAQWRSGRSRARPGGGQRSRPGIRVAHGPCPSRGSSAATARRPGSCTDDTSRHASTMARRRCRSCASSS